MYLTILGKLLLGGILELLYFPFWWYGRGAVNAAEACWRIFKRANEQLAPGLWLVNIFVPMYGQYDWEGRSISFFMRLVQVVIRSFLLLIWALICFSFFLVWLIIPMALVYGLCLKDLK